MASGPSIASPQISQLVGARTFLTPRRTTSLSSAMRILMIVGELAPVPERVSPDDRGGFIRIFLVTGLVRLGGGISGHRGLEGNLCSLVTGFNHHVAAKVAGALAHASDA